MEKRRSFVEKLPDDSQLFGYNYLDYPLHKFHIFDTFESVYSLHPNAAGDDYWHRECFRQRVNSNTFAVEYVSEGCFIFTHNGIEVKCNPGEIFLVHMGCSNSMRCETVTAVKKVINIGGPLLRPLLSATGLDRVFCIRPADNTRIDRIFADVYREAEKKAQDGYILSSLCYELLLTLAEQAVNVARPEELTKALFFIRRSLERQISLEDISKAAGVSKATLNRMFQEYFQCSPINYFLDLKMSRARALLPYYPVKKVAAMLNYSSSQYFSSEFKKHYGLSPKSFRSRLSGEAAAQKSR